MLTLVTGGEMREIEADLEQSGISIEELISRAGAAVAGTISRVAPVGHVLVLVGPGNNGSDGLTAAELLRSAGRNVLVYVFRRTGSGEYSGDITNAGDDPGGDKLAQLISNSSVVVDALLGTGQSRAPDGALAVIIAVVNGRASGKKVLAVDVPTGVDASNGAVPTEAIHATLTLCLGFAKRGVALFPGAAYAGAVEVAPIGMAPKLAEDISVFRPDDADIAALLPQRKPEANKGASGRMLFLGGSRDFIGAPMLCAMAAYRTGAGLVEVAVPASIVNPVASHALEPIYHPLKEEEGKLSVDSLSGLGESLTRARGVVIGPGMAMSPGTVLFVRSILEKCSGAESSPLLVDADALNALTSIDQWWKYKAPAVVTPHPGEMARLTGLTIEEIQGDRVGVATRYAEHWRTIVVLKGAGTVIASPQGKVVINPTGGPNLATAGTGDVLSGMIGSLLAQGGNPWDAAVAGVYLHGRAGDLLRAKKGDVGTVASDLIEHLPAARLSVFEKSEDET